MWLIVISESSIKGICFPQGENADIPSGEDLKSKMSAIASVLPLSDAQSQVSVTLTLSATAAENIGGVISAIADLLKIAVPPSYEISRSPSPEYGRGLAYNKRK